jgi:hypothetical protein
VSIRSSVFAQRGRVAARVPVGLRAALVAVLVACTGCGVAPAPRYPIREANPFLAAIRARATRFRTLRARGVADNFGRQGRVRGSIVIFVEQPNKMRVDTFAFGNLISSMVSNGQLFTLLQGTNFYTGPARPCVAAQLLGIPMESSDVVAVLTGGAPVLSDRVSTPRWENGRYVIDVAGDAGSSERIEMELPPNEHDLQPAQQHPRLARVVLRDRQGVRAEIDYRNYTAVQGTPFPTSVHVVMRRDDVDMMLRFDEVQPNYTVPPDPDDPDAPTPNPFVQTPPAGATQHPIGC